MWDHLRLYHKKIYSHLQESKAKPSKQPKIEVFKVQEMYPISSKKHTIINNILVDFVCAGLHPFSIVDEPMFKKFVKELDPQYQCPTGQTIGTTTLEKRYNEVTTNIKESLNALPDGYSINLTIDGWASTDKDRNKYNSLTCVYFHPKSEKIVKHTLGFAATTESMTSKKILSELIGILNEYNIKEKNFKFNLITDTASNMLKLKKIVIFLFKLFNFLFQDR